MLNIDMKMSMKIIYSSILLLSISCTKLSYKTWDNGEIPFLMIGFSDAEQKQIVEWLSLWTINTGGEIQFKISDEIKNENIVYFIKTDNSCAGGISDGVGENPYGINTVYISNLNKRNILHESGHVIGLQHEHQRPDRGLYIKLTWNEKSIPLLCLSQIIQLNYFFLYDFKKYPYDINSIMHYTKSEFYSMGCELDISDNASYIDNNEEISLIDSIKIIDIYNNKNKPEYKLE